MTLRSCKLIRSIQAMQAVLLVLLFALAACVRAQGCTAQQIYDGAYIWQSFGWDTTIVEQDNTHQFNGKPSVCWTASMYTGICAWPHGRRIFF